MFTNKDNLFPSMMVGDVCGGKKIDLKTVAPRKVVVCSVITGYGGVSYDCSTE